MGCTLSSSAAFDEVSQTLEFKRLIKELKVLQLNNADIRKFYHVFDTIVSAGMTTITLTELLEHLNLPHTPFTEKLFTIFSSGTSEELNFRAFTLAVWNFCTLTRINIDMFTFDLYDKDGKKPLITTEVLTIFEDIFGKEAMSTDVHARRASEELQALEERKKTFSIERFHVFMMNHQAVLFPAIQMQQKVRQKVLGASFWEKQTAIRVGFTREPYISIAQILDPGKLGISSIHNVCIKGASGGPGSNKQKRANSRIYIDTDTASIGTSTIISASGKRLSSANLFPEDSLKKQPSPTTAGLALLDLSDVLDPPYVAHSPYGNKPHKTFKVSPAKVSSRKHHA